MKNLLLSTVLILFQFLLYAQTKALEIAGKEVFKNEDVIFHQIDEHTWVGTGNLTINESLYLVEGNKKAVLIDAGTRINDLDKIVASITKKPVMLVATHVHPDHTGSSVNFFPELYINEADTINISQYMPGYKGKLRYFKDNQIINLGGRKLEVVFTPGHTPGSTTFIDKEAGYGFSGDSFGSGNLLLTTNFSTLITTCQKTSALMDKYGIKYFYPGHFFGKNIETKKRIDDMVVLSRDVLSGKVKGQVNPKARIGLDLIVSDYGVRINYNQNALK
jgi:hydroxyacylglutathione hydrolase